jgi:hypothetical protein
MQFSIAMTTAANPVIFSRVTESPDRHDFA